MKSRHQWCGSGLLVWLHLISSCPILPSQKWDRSVLEAAASSILKVSLKCARRDQSKAIESNITSGDIEMCGFIRLTLRSLLVCYGQSAWSLVLLTTRVCSVFFRLLNTHSTVLLPSLHRCITKTAKVSANIAVASWFLGSCSLIATGLKKVVFNKLHVLFNKHHLK